MKGNITIEHLNNAVAGMINGKTDRECAILAAAFLEGLLYDYLLRITVSTPLQESKALFEYPRPLGSFGNMVSLAYAFGQISHGEFISLRLVQRIRNHAAHSLGLESDDSFAFGKEPVRGMLREFHPKKVMDELPAEVKSKIKEDLEGFLDFDAKMLFRLNFCLVSLGLFSRIQIAPPLSAPNEINQGVEDEPRDYGE